MYQPIILTDLDNTIYNWVDYFAPSFRAMVHVISRQTGINEETIIEDFKKVYNHRSSLEYSFSVQELTLCKSMTSDQIENLVRIARGTFSRVRQKNLFPYPEVRETLHWAKEKNIRVIAVTNTSIFQAERRIKYLRLDGLFYGLAGWEGQEVPEGFLTEEIKKKADTGEYTSRIQKFWPLKSEQLKPNPFGYLKILDELKVSHKTTYVIGDSLYKDIKPAIEIDAIGIWAEYGTKFKQKNFDTLLKITHWDQDKISSVYDEKSISPNFIINSFSELTKIVKPLQLELF